MFNEYSIWMLNCMQFVMEYHFQWKQEGQSLKRAFEKVPVALCATYCHLFSANNVHLGDGFQSVCVHTHSTSAPFASCSAGILDVSLDTCVYLTVELEFFLRPTVSRPVRLGIGPPFGTLDQILSCSSFASDNYFILHFYFRVLHPVARNIEL
jgi:hypothetical protein